jgi:serine/threonine-protein kinase
MIGSPFYMSPEQILGSKNIDHRSDLWSVGVVAFEALTGQKPFDAETMGGLAIRIHSEPLPLVTKALPGISPAVDAWFQRACARPAPDRFNTAKEMAESLAAALGGEMPRSVGMPKSATGSNRHDPMVNEPTLATTDAGLSALSRSTPAPNTRNRLIALVGVGAVLAFGAFFGVSYLKKAERDPTKDAKALTSEPAPPLPPSALTSEPAPPSALPAAIKAAPPTSLSPLPAPSTAPAPAPVPKPAHRPKPPASSASPVTHPPLPSPSPSPAPAPAPGPTNRDIF